MRRSGVSNGRRTRRSGKRLRVHEPGAGRRARRRAGPATPRQQALARLAASGPACGRRPCRTRPRMPRGGGWPGLRPWWRLRRELGPRPSGWRRWPGWSAGGSASLWPRPPSWGPRNCARRCCRWCGATRGRAGRRRAAGGRPGGVAPLAVGLGRSSGRHLAGQPGGLGGGRPVIPPSSCC
jgi:hypothetical protein